MTDASDETHFVEICHMQLSNSLLLQNVFQEKILG
jgi:hypothetical protein